MPPRRAHARRRRNFHLPLPIIARPFEPCWLRGCAARMNQTGFSPSRAWAMCSRATMPHREVPMFPTPKPSLSPNTYAYESEPLVKATGFREYDARWLFGQEINLMGVQALGMGLGTLIRQMGVRPEIVTGHDFRSYSASIKYALV